MLAHQALARPSAGTLCHDGSLSRTCATIDLCHEPWVSYPGSCRKETLGSSRSNGRYGSNIWHAKALAHQALARVARQIASIVDRELVYTFSHARTLARKRGKCLNPGCGTRGPATPTSETLPHHLRSSDSSDGLVRQRDQELVNCPDLVNDITWSIAGQDIFLAGQDRSFLKNGSKEDQLTSGVKKKRLTCKNLTILLGSKLRA